MPCFSTLCTLGTAAQKDGWILLSTRNYQDARQARWQELSKRCSDCETGRRERWRLRTLSRQRPSPNPAPPGEEETCAFSALGTIEPSPFVVRLSRVIQHPPRVSCLSLAHLPSPGPHYPSPPLTTQLDQSTLLASHASCFLPSPSMLTVESSLFWLPASAAKMGTATRSLLGPPFNPATEGDYGLGTVMDMLHIPWAARCCSLTLFR